MCAHAALALQRSADGYTSARSRTGEGFAGFIDFNQPSQRVSKILALFTCRVGDGHGVAGVRVLRVSGAGRGDLRDASQGIVGERGVDDSVSRSKGIGDLGALPQLVIAVFYAADQAPTVLGVHLHAVVQTVQGCDRDGTVGCAGAGYGRRSAYVIKGCINLDRRSALRRQGSLD